MPTEIGQIQVLRKYRFQKVLTRLRFVRLAVDVYRRHGRSIPGYPSSKSAFSVWTALVLNVMFKVVAEIFQR